MAESSKLDDIMAKCKWPNLYGWWGFPISGITKAVDAILEFTPMLRAIYVL